MAGLVIRTTGIEDYLDDGDAYIKALIMGQASAGKTRSASFWPKPIFADTEKGRMSIADRKVPYVEINSSDEMFALLDMLRAECRKPMQSRQYQTLVIDTLDSFQRKVIAERLAAEHKESLSGWSDWGYLDAKMTLLVEQMLNLKMNIVVNLHLKEKGGSGDDEGPAQKEPKLKGDIRDQIANEFDLVGHMATYWEAREGERTLVRGIKWVPEPSFPILKDRSGKLPAFTPVDFTEQDYTGLLGHFTAGIDSLTASEDVGEVPMAEPTAPAPANLAGGPVPAPKSEAVPRSAAKKAAPPVKKAAAAPPTKEVAPAALATAPATAPAAPPPVPAARAVPPATKPVEVVEGGASAAPAAEAQPESEEQATTPVVTEPTEAEAEATLAETLGATPVEEPEAAEPEAAAPAAAPAASGGEPPLPCGTAGKMRDGTTNPEPVSGCGGNIREIAASDEDKDRVNIAFLGTRTYLCPACYAAHKASA